MITNKDIRVENGSLILNGDPYPLDGQSPAAIMKIVEDNSDTTPTENSKAPITSGGVFTALGAILNFTHFVQVDFDTSALDSIKNAFASGLIPSDLNGVTIGLVKASAGGGRVVFIAQNQSDTGQTRYAAIYFGAYTAPRFCQKQDGSAWTDVAL